MPQSLKHQSDGKKDAKMSIVHYYGQFFYIYIFGSFSAIFVAYNKKVKHLSVSQV